jgi:hypothetical protein
MRAVRAVQWNLKEQVKLCICVISTRTSKVRTIRISSIGGLLIPDQKAIDFENPLGEIAFNFFGARSLMQVNEFHGKELFHGKGNAKGRTLADRVQVFQNIATFVTDNQIPYAWFASMSIITAGSTNIPHHPIGLD